MPVLPNARHERFAQELANGLSAAKAYVSAGYKEHRHNASALARKKPIIARVAELQQARYQADDEATARANEALAIDKQWLIEKAEEARVMAMANKQSAAAIAAVKELGILSGYRVEKRENMTRSAHDMTDDELMEIAAGGRNTLQ